MAIVIFGKTKCPVCGAVILEQEKLISFPALFSEDHKYHLCSDATFHESCFDKWEYSESALRLYEQYLELLKKRPSIPQNMDFSEFEESDVYKEFMRSLERILEQE